MEALPFQNQRFSARRIHPSDPCSGVFRQVSGCQFWMRLLGSGVPPKPFAHLDGLEPQAIVSLKGPNSPPLLTAGPKGDFQEPASSVALTNCSTPSSALHSPGSPHHQKSPYLPGASQRSNSTRLDPEAPEQAWTTRTHRTFPALRRTSSWGLRFPRSHLLIPTRWLRMISTTPRPR